MKSNGALNVRQAPTWNKGKAVFIAFALLTLLIISALVDISLHQQTPATKNLVSFTCHTSPGNQTFTIDVDVNLTDNMDQDEAIRVAVKVYAKSIPLYANPPASFSTTTLEGADGIWLVEFDTAYTFSSYCAQNIHVMTRILRERFVAIINPFAHTVMYTIMYTRF